MKSPARWNETLIKSPHGDLTKKDVFDFYTAPAIKKHVLKSIGDNSFIVRQTFKPGNTVLRRKMPGGATINKSHLPKLLKTRATEIHPTFGKKVDTVLADIDPQKGVPWKKTKSITELVAKTMQSHPDVKDVSVRFSGGTGFYVEGKLPKAIHVDKARAMSKQILDGITKRPDVTFGVAKPGQIRLDTTPLKHRGSIRGAYSLNAQTGLVSAPVDLKKLPKVEKSDFTVKSILKKANYDDILEGIKNEQLRQQLLPALKSYESASDPAHGITHIREVVNAARQIMPETGVDPEQVLTAAILHDIGREHEMQTGEAHQAAGARMAKPYLQSLNHAARYNILHSIRQHSSTGQPRTLMAKLVRDADKLPYRIDNVALPRRMAEYRIARGMPADQIAEDARKYILDKRKFTPDRRPSLLTPKAIELAKPFEATRNEMINDPVKWQTAMQPFLPKQAADEVQQVSGAPTPQAIAAVQRKAFGLSKKELANGVPLAMQQVPTPTGEAQNAVLLKVSKEFAPGIPMNRKIKKIPTATNQPWTLAVQYHKAKKAGPHYDLRLVPSIGGDAHSWALPKATLPESGKMRLAIQQPTHTADYALNFEGKIPKGYGAGTVTMPIKEQVNVIKAGPHSIMFQRPNKDKFTMFRMGDTKWGIKKISSADGIFEKIADLLPASITTPFPSLKILNFAGDALGQAFGISAGKVRHHSAKVKRLTRSKFLAKPKVTAFIRDHMRA